MSQGAATARQCEIGTYTCPNTGRRLPLMAAQPLPAVEWPVVVAQCKACGETHQVRRQDLVQTPVLGYE